MQMMKMMEINIKEIIEEYKPNDDIFSDDSDDVGILKESVMNLTSADKIIFLLYSELASYRKVAKILGVSHTIIYKQIKKIREDIREWIVLHYPMNNELIKRLENDIN